MDCQKYQFWRAVRPFSFTVALCACLTGIASAYAAGIVEPLLSVLVLLAGVFLQAGVNLINDYADLSLLRRQQGEDIAEAVFRIRRNFRTGLGCFALAAVIAFYLIAQVGLTLLWLCVVGLIGALTYTLNPVNYKARGLGVVLVFWLMGVLMVAGSYLAVSGQLTAAIIWQSIPISLLVSLLLLSNELRDFEADQRDRIGTLAVRIGYKRAALLYQLLLSISYLSALGLWWHELLPQFWPLLLTLPAVIAPLRLLGKPTQERITLTPKTGRLLALFGVAYCVALIA